VAWVQHTEAGSEAGTISTFMNNSAQVSAWCSMGLKGDVDLYGPPSDSYWANGILEPGNLWQRVVAPAQGVRLNANPNEWTLNSESEDLGSGATPVSQAEFDAVRWALDRAQQFKDGNGNVYGDSMKWLLRHTDISPLSRPNCCGTRWTSGRFQALAQEFGLRTTEAWWPHQAGLISVDLMPYLQPQACQTPVEGMPGGVCGHLLEAHLVQLPVEGHTGTYDACGLCGCQQVGALLAVELQAA
jgi:hypothetical protein